MKHLARILILTLVTFLLSAYGGLTFSSAQAEIDETNGGPVLELTETRVLRDSANNYIRTVPAGSRIQIDPKYLSANLGPSVNLSQVEQLLNFPKSAKRKLAPSKYISRLDGTAQTAYFVPVQVSLPDGSIAKGQMALRRFQGFSRWSDMASPKENGPTSPVQSESLSEEGKIGVDCNCDSKATSRVESLQEIQVPPYSSFENSLFRRYQDFVQKFRASRKLSRTNSGMVKNRFLEELTTAFSEPEATKILKALTVFQEAPSRLGEIETIAHMAAVLKVIDNRVDRQYRSEGNLFAMLGLDEKVSAATKVIFSRLQFSCWNSGSSGLLSILGTHRQDPKIQEKLRLAFETVEKMANGEIDFIGKLRESTVLHYAAIPVSWANENSRLRDEVVTIKAGPGLGETIATVALVGGNTFYDDVDKNSVKGKK